MLYDVFLTIEFTWEVDERKLVKLYPRIVILFVICMLLPLTVIPPIFSKVNNEVPEKPTAHLSHEVLIFQSNSQSRTRVSSLFNLL